MNSLTHTVKPRKARQPWAVRTVVVRLSRKLTATYRIRSGRLLSRLLVAMLAGFPNLAVALPVGGDVVSGQASVSTPTANHMQVQQGSDKAIINWQSFSIGVGQSVQFVQPGAASVALNRVTGANPSAIYGSLSANGQVFLVNPAGVMFAPGAQVNVGGLVASSLAISNEDFLAGRYTFSGPGSGSVVNHGSINAARAGYVLLAGSSVSNTGTIATEAGSTGLLAGSRVTLDTSGAGLVRFSVDAAAVNAAASNSGTITAAGGQVAMLASALGDAMATVVNQSGVIRATSATESNGMIVLSGGRSGMVRVAGTLDASGRATGQTGGTVKVLGDKVVLASTASIDASGSSGGGTVLVGGNYQGKGAEQNAALTLVASGASIDASAISAGNGGKVVVWADSATGFYGAIKATGGAEAGNGGFAEVSGKQTLAFDGAVNLSAPRGTAGTLLLDPLNIIINNAGAATYADVSTFAAQAGTTQTVSIATLNAVVGNITLQATNDITLSNVFAVTANKSVSLEANNNINIDAALSTSGTGAINLKADADAVGGGTLALAAAVTAQAGGVTLSGASVTSTGAGSISATGAGNANAGNVDITATGVINLTGAITANGGTATAGNPGRTGGAVSITGVGGVTTAAITANGSNGNGAGQAGGGAGSISVSNSGSGNIVTGALLAQTGNAAAGGAAGGAGSISVSNTATAGNVTTGVLTTTGGTFGHGGAVTLNALGTVASGNINTTGGTTLTGNAGRNAGTVSITGAGVNLGASTITASGTAGVGTSQTGGAGGEVSITSTNGVTQTGAITASGGAGSTTAGAGGNAGSITVANTVAGAVSLGALAAQTGAAVGSGAGGTVGSISVSNTAGNLTTGTLTTTGGLNGNGGNITVTAANGTVVTGNVIASGGAAGGTSNGRNAGSINISGAALTLGASTITANGIVGSTLGTGGNGGAITLSSTGAISSSGAISAIGGNGVGADQAGGSGAAVSVSSTGGSVAVGSITTTGGNGVAGVAAGGNAGAITLTGVGVTVASNVSAVGGTATGGAAAGSGGAVQMDAGTGTYTQNDFDINAGTGPITVIADTVAISNNTLNNALTSSGTVTIKAKTANRAMSLAGASAFDISAAEITAIATGATGPIVIGDTASTGVLTIGGAVTLSGKTVTLNAGSMTDTGTQTITALNVTLNANGQIGTSSANGIDIAATNLSVNTTGNANAFVRTGAINLGVGTSASSVGSGTLDLTASGAVTQTATTGNITAGTLKVQNLTANAPITLTNTGNNATTVNLQATLNGAIQYTSGTGFDVAAVTTGGNATLSSGGAVTQSGAIAAAGLALTGTGGTHTLRHASNAVTTLAANTGSVDYSQAGALFVGTVGVAGVTTTGTAKIETTGAASNLTLNNAVTSSASGDAIVLKAGSSNAAGTSTGGQLINSVGLAGIVATAGRYLVYSGDPGPGAGTTIEGVTGYSKRYNTASSFTPGGSANMFLYRIAPTLTITSDNATKTYGQVNPVFTGNSSGYIDGDTAASVGVTRTSAAVFNTPVAQSGIAITSGATNNENYTLVLSNGNLQIDKASISNVSGITANNKVVDGNTGATLNTGGAVYNGIVAGDVLRVSGAGNFDTPFVGANKLVLIKGLVLSGAAADNYTLIDNTATTRAAINDLSSFSGALFIAPPPPPVFRARAAGLSVADANALLESAPTASGGCGASGAAEGCLSVSALREATDQAPGLVSVTVAGNGSGFQFSMPSGVLAGAAGSTTPVEVATLSGRPLPDWLRYDADKQVFVASSPPPGALPLQIRVSRGERSAIVTITEAQAGTPASRGVIVQRQADTPARTPG